ncbi:MAG: DNA-3-methyladenine glycosylase, partial [Bacteroidota bacterium]
MIPIPQDWYASEDVVELARNLLGKMIISRVGDRFTSGMIVETEAYRAPDDKGSHAYGNRHTKRTATMFGPPGCAYVYLCYGIHHLCNVVTGPPDTAHAVLIRAVEPIEGTEHISHRRSMPQTVYHLTNGPGKWTKALGITTALDGIPYHDPSSPVIICEG